MKLVNAVIHDVRNLFLFIVLWIFMFTLFYQVLGFEVDVSLDEMTLWQYFIISWKVATKGSDKSVASFWQEQKEITSTTGGTIVTSSSLDLSYMDTIIMAI